MTLRQQQERCLLEWQIREAIKDRPVPERWWPEPEPQPEPEPIRPIVIEAYEPPIHDEWRRLYETGFHIEGWPDYYRRKSA